MPDFNDVRLAYGLLPINTFLDLTGDAQLASDLEALYGPTLTGLDPWVGMLAEKHIAGSSRPQPSTPFSRRSSKPCATVTASGTSTTCRTILIFSVS